MSTLTHSLSAWPQRQPLAFLALASALWFGLYQLLNPFSEAVVAQLPVEHDSQLGGALQFCFYDTPKVLMLLTGGGGVMGMVNSYSTPELSVIALSLPEMIVLRKVPRVRLIATFVAVVASGILLVGFVFNAVLWPP